MSLISKKLTYIFAGISALILVGIVAGVFLWAPHFTTEGEEALEKAVSDNDSLETSLESEGLQAGQNAPTKTTDSQVSLVSATFELLETTAVVNNDLYGASFEYPRAQAFLRLVVQNKDGRTITTEPFLVMDEVPLSCNKLEPHVDTEAYTIYADALEYVHCWYAGGGRDMGIFLRTSQNGAQSVTVESRAIGECGMVEDCVPYGNMETIAQIPLVEPLQASTWIQMYEKVVESFRSSVSERASEQNEKSSQDIIKRFIIAMKSKYNISLTTATQVYSLPQKTMNKLVNHYEADLRSDTGALFQGITKRSPSMMVYTADINGDGLKDYFVSYQSTTCGMHNCELTVFETKADDSLAMIGGIGAETGMPVLVATSSSGVYLDLAFPNHWLTGVGILRWNGKEYEDVSFIGKEDKPENTLVP